MRISTKGTVWAARDGRHRRSLRRRADSHQRGGEKAGYFRQLPRADYLPAQKAGIVKKRAGLSGAICWPARQGRSPWATCCACLKGTLRRWNASQTGESPPVNGHRTVRRSAYGRSSRTPSTGWSTASQFRTLSTAQNKTPSWISAITFKAVKRRAAHPGRASSFAVSSERKNGAGASALSLPLP